MIFYEKFKPEELTLKEFDNWIVLLRQKQITLGSCVIILKREVGSLANVSPEEMSQLPEAISWYEEKCIALFGAEKFNYYAAMMKDNFVHFHGFPRYSKPITACNAQWIDELWPKPISLIDVPVNEELLLNVLTELKG
jgi:diadenosine tetraphosphate (Ap4A) HIT family hydrolase